jgi:hypothetical protein
MNDPLHDSGDRPYVPPSAATPMAAPVGHSGPGITSFVIGLLGSLGLLATFGYATYLEMNTPGGIDENSPVAMLTGLAMIGCILMLLLGLLLGVAGLFQSGRKKLFAALGVFINGFVIAIGALVIGIGMAAGG